MPAFTRWVEMNSREEGIINSPLDTLNLKGTGYSSREENRYEPNSIIIKARRMYQGDQDLLNR